MKVQRLKKRQLPLPLTNDGALAIIPIGCGSAFSKKLYQNNILIIKGDHHVMVDCGTRMPMALAELGRSVTDVSNWLITHSHADHIGGLEEVMLMGRYFAQKKPDIIITPEYEKLLWNRSLRGANEFNEHHDGKGLSFSDYWNPVRPTKLNGYPRDTREIQIGELNIKLVRTMHYPQQAASWEDSAYSVGLLLDDRVLFTGDTRFDPDLLESFDKQFDLQFILHDVQFFTGGIHTGIDELASLPGHLRERMLLMHYGDAYLDHQQRIRSEGYLGFMRQHWIYTFD